MVLSDNCGAADRALLMAKFRTYANLELITNDRVAGVQGRASADAPLSSSEPQTYVLKSGQTIQADVYMQVRPPPCAVKAERRFAPPPCRASSHAAVQSRQPRLRATKPPAPARRFSGLLVLGGEGTA